MNHRNNTSFLTQFRSHSTKFIHPDPPFFYRVLTSRSHILCVTFESEFDAINFFFIRPHHHPQTHTQPFRAGAAETLILGSEMDQFWGDKLMSPPSSPNLGPEVILLIVILFIGAGCLDFMVSH